MQFFNTCQKGLCGCVCVFKDPYILCDAASGPSAQPNTELTGLSGWTTSGSHTVLRSNGLSAAVLSTVLWGDYERPPRPWYVSGPAKIDEVATSALNLGPARYQVTPKVFCR